MKRIGAFFEAGGSYFCVWAPDKKKVELELNPDQLPVYMPMVKDRQGYWELKVALEAGTKYKYRIDGGQSVPDPASRSQPDGVHGPSVLTDKLSSERDDEDWSPPALGDLIMYEIHTGCFSQGQNFQGIIEKLDYLREVGINAIELMPVAAFPGVRNWGYDGVCAFAVQESYGGLTGLKELINAAHKKGIAVIMDVVYNHTGPDGNYLSFWGPYFTTKYKSFWGQSFNLDDKFSDAVRNYIIQNALMWLDEFHVDGLRLDAVHAIIDHAAIHLMQELRENVTALSERIKQKKLLIAEIDLNDVRYIGSPEKGGYGLDAQWADEFHHSLHSLLTGEQTGYYEDFGRTEHLVKAINKSYVYDGNYSVHRKRHFGSDATALSADRFVVFTQNHDQTGNRWKGERLSTLVSFSKLKLAAAVMLLSPYIPLIFMGEEYAEKNPFLFFIDYTDPALTESTRKGRKEEFAYFGSESDFPDPASAETFVQSGLSWNRSDASSQEMLKWYQWLIRFRKTRRAMKGKLRTEFDAVSPADKLIVMNRTHGGDHIQIVFNFSDSPQLVSLGNNGMLRRILQSESESWGGTESDDDAELNSNFTIAANSVSVFELIN